MSCRVRCAAKTTRAKRFSSRSRQSSTVTRAMLLPLGFGLGEIRDDGELGLLPGGAMTFDACPAYSVVTDSAGLASAFVPPGAPIVTRLTAPGHIPVLVSRARIDAASVMSDVVPASARAL